MQQHYFGQRLTDVLILFGLDATDCPAVLWNRALYLFLIAAITNDHTLNGLNNTHVS